MRNSNDSLNEYVVTVPNENGELEDFDILAKDLFDEHIRIHPEKLKTESIRCYKTANELLKYFNQEEELQSIGADNNYIAGMSALRTMMIDKGKNDPNGRYGLHQYLPVNLNEEEFHDYVLQRIKEMDEIESNLVRLIKANLLLNRSDYLEIKQLEAVTDKKKYIKTLKTRVKNNPKLFIHREGFNTTVFDFGIYGRGKVYINDEIYEKEPRWREVLEPSRFLVRASIYDYIIIVHGTIMKNGQWAILDGITVNGKNYISINQLIKDLNPVKNKILLMVCNEENVVPDMSEFPTLDYGTHRVLMESSQFQLSKHFTTEKLLKEWINYMKNRIKELNKFYQSILDQIDAMDITLYPEKMHYVRYPSTFDTPVFIETKRVSNIKDYKTECYKNNRDLIHIYDQFLLNCIIFAKALQKMKSNGTNESVGSLFYYREGLPIIMGAASISCTQPIGYEYESLEEAIEDITIHKSIPDIDDTYNPTDCINYTLKKSDGTKSFKNIELQKALDFILPDIYQVNGNPKTSDIENIEEYPKHDDILNFNKFKVFMRDIFNNHNYSFSSDIEQPTEQEISTLISKFNQANGIISDLNVKVSKNIKEFLDTVSYIEEYIHKIISQNIKLICTDINSCSLNVLSVKEKELNEKYYTRFTIIESDDTIMIDLIPLGLGRIYISKEYYRPINKSEVFKFLLRSNHYNLIIISNGSFGIYHEKPTWEIDPITINGKQYHNLDEIREYAKQNGINRVALIMNDHSNINATNLIYYDNIDYKFDYDFDLTPIPKILITTNDEFTIKSCISYYLNKIEELNNLEYHLMKYIDEMEQVDSNDSFTSIRFIKTNFTYIAKRVDRENEDKDIIKQRKLYYECIENSFKMYRSILYDTIYHLMDRLS